MTELEVLIVHAEKGEADSQYKLGVEYECGGDVSRDPAESFKWYSKAAEQGHAEAQVALGNALEYGWGVSQDQQEAIKWYRRAHTLGSASAALNLGSAYHHGQGVKQNFEKAEELYLEYYYSDENIPTGWVELTLGDLYRDCMNPKRNDDEAYDFYLRSAGLGEPNSQFALGEMYREGADCLDIDYGIAIDWYQEAAKDRYGPPAAFLKIGEMYEKGLGMATNHVRAYMNYKIAESKGLELAGKRRENYEIADLKGRELAGQRRMDLMAKMSSQQIAEAENLVREWKKANK